jgi:2-dehydropantoate 2-reductase
MVNTAKGYEEWEGIIGTEKLIAAFPGAGGGIENGVLHYKLTPFIVQPMPDLHHRHAH